MASFRHYIKNLPKEFGKVFEAILAVFGRLNPEDIAKIRDWSRNEETGKRGENIPDAFIPYIAWEMGCLYEALYFDRFQERITADDILKYKDLRRYEGTDYGLKNAIELIPAVESAEISRILGENALPACVFRLIAKLADDREFEKKDWKFFYYLVNDYKRKSAKCLIDFKRDVEVHPLKVNHAVRCDRIVEFRVQEVGGELAILSPASLQAFYFGDTVTISGTCSLADGTTAQITITMPDNTTVTLTATVNSGLFSATWNVPTNHGTGDFAITITALHLQESVTISAASHVLTMSTPEAGDEIQLENSVTVSGITDFADGSVITLSLTQNGETTTIGTATAASGAFTYLWTTEGNAGDAVISASCGGITATVSVTLASAFTVVAPTANQAVLAGTPFSVEVESEAVGNVLVYAGSTLIATIPISDGVAEETAAIPSEILGIGSAFIIEDGEEVPVGNITTLALTFTDGLSTKNVNVRVTTDSGFDIGTAQGTAKASPDIDKTFELDLFGTAEVSGTAVIGDRETMDFVDLGTAAAAADADNVINELDVFGTANAGIIPSENHEDDCDFGTAVVTITATEEE